MAQSSAAAVEGQDLEALVRRRTAELEYRLEFEELLVSLSTKFINLPVEAFDEAISTALGTIGRFTGVDRCFIYQLDPSGESTSLTHEWCSPGTPRIQPVMQGIPLGRFQWEKSELGAGRTLAFEDTSKLPTEASGIGSMYRQLGIRSALNVPLLWECRLIGMLGLSTISGPREWSQEHVALIKVLAEVLVNAIERCATKQALAQSEERLRLTIEGVEEGLYDWEIQTGMVVVSDYWLRMMGLPEGENPLSDQVWRKSVHPDDWPSVEAELKRHFAKQTPVFEAEYRMRRADGAYQWTLDRGKVVEWSEAGEPLRMVGVDRDITDAIEAREQRERLQSQLAHLGRVAATGETVAGIAHEVNQPLHAASTFSAAARSALQSGNTAKADELCQKSSEQITRAGEIIRRMREFTRPRPSESVPVDLNPLIRESAGFVLSYNRRACVALTFDFDEGLSPVQGDAVQLQQVAVNVIQNGVDSVQQSRGPDGKIAIRTRSDAGWAIVEFRDNGAGVEEQDPESLFDMFVTTKPGGMGMGLSLCRTIVESHNGSITASRNEGPGMTFTIKLPLMNGVVP